MRKFDKKQSILEANLVLEEQSLISNGLITEEQLNELKEYLKKDGIDDPVLISEVVLTVATILAGIGIGLSIGKGADAIGFIFRKLVEWVSGKKMGKTFLEKWGEKYHKKIIQALAWILRKAGFDEDQSKLIANILFWTLIVVTMGYGHLPHDMGRVVTVVKNISTMVKSYEIGVLVIAGLIWVEEMTSLKPQKFPDLVHAVEHCVEDKRINIGLNPLKWIPKITQCSSEYISHKKELSGLDTEKIKKQKSVGVTESKDELEKMKHLWSFSYHGKLNII